MTNKELEIKACKLFRQPQKAKIREFCEDLELSDELILAAEEFYTDFINRTYNMAHYYAISQKAIVASCIYIISYLKEEYRSQEKIAETIKVSVPTIRKHYQDIVKVMDIEMELPFRCPSHLRREK